jgi:hypothetical protein
MYAQPNSSGAAAVPMLLHSQFVNVNFPTLSTPDKAKKYLSLSTHFTHHQTFCPHPSNRPTTPPQTTAILLTECRELL